MSSANVTFFFLLKKGKGVVVASVWRKLIIGNKQGERRMCATLREMHYYPLKNIYKKLQRGRERKKKQMAPPLPLEYYTQKRSNTHLCTRRVPAADNCGPFSRYFNKNEQLYVFFFFVSIYYYYYFIVSFLHTQYNNARKILAYFKFIWQLLKAHHQRLVIRAKSFWGLYYIMLLGARATSAAPCATLVCVCKHLPKLRKIKRKLLENLIALHLRACIYRTQFYTLLVT